MGSTDGMNLPLIIALVAGGVVLVVVGVLLIVFLRRRESKIEIKKEDAIDNEEWVKALGGKENIKSIEAKGSRLVVQLNNNELLDKDLLHTLGVSSIIFAQDKITLVVKDKAENIRNLLQ